MKVTWHDPCHIGRHGGIYEESREVLEAIPGLELKEMEHNRKDGLCCGSVLTLIGETRPTSGRIAHERLMEARMPTMSDSMREVMPDILPKVMDKVMPYMMPRIMRCMLS